MRGEERGLTSLLFVETVAAAGLVVAAMVALVDRRMMPRARPQQAAHVPVSVSAIVPARNEAANIVAWLHDVLLQTHPAERVIVADDCSDDDTATVARNAVRGEQGVEVASFGSPPAGWVGKNWAAYNAASESRSDWLLFSDADVRMAPHALSAALALVHELGADAISLSATLECEGWLQRQIMPVIAAIIFSGMPVFLVNDDRAPTGLLAGGFLLVRRTAYEQVGGHRAVRASIAEDRDLAERLKAFGYRIRLADGAQLIRVRMYRSAREMWMGWRKNFYEGARRKLPFAIAFVASCVATLVLPLPLLIAFCVRWLRAPLGRRERQLAFVCGVSVGGIAIVRAARDRSIGARTSFVSLLTTPIGGLFAAAVMTASAWRVQTGKGQIWKGRVIR